MSSSHPIQVATRRTDIDACREIRRRVFVVEQGIPAELDADGLDAAAVHVLVHRDGVAAATGRLVTSGDAGVLARIAVLAEFRGQGLGGQVVQGLEAAARERGLRQLSLHPHEYLEEFYQRLGYHTVPGTSAAGGHTLITMVKELDGP